MQMPINSEFQQHHAVNVKRELIDQGYINSNTAPPHNQQHPSSLTHPGDNFCYLTLLNTPDHEIPDAFWAEFNLTKPTLAEIKATTDSHVQPEAAPVVEREPKVPECNGIREGMKVNLVDGSGRDGKGDSIDNPICL